MNNQKTIRALEDLAKSEYSTATALDLALAEAKDAKLRSHFRKFRDAHIKQAEVLNSRIKQLGGQSPRYSFADGSLYRLFWNLMPGTQDHKKVAGVRLVAGRGLKQYADHVDDIDDPKALAIVLKNLEAKQDEMKWYDDQVVAEHSLELAAELTRTRELAKALEQEVKAEKRARRQVPASPFAALFLAAIAAAVVYFLSRRKEEEPEEEAFVEAYSHNGSVKPTPTPEPVGV